MAIRHKYIAGRYANGGMIVVLGSVEAKDIDQALQYARMRWFKVNRSDIVVTGPGTRDFHPAPPEPEEVVWWAECEEYRRGQAMAARSNEDFHWMSRL